MSYHAKIRRMTPPRPHALSGLFDLIFLPATAVLESSSETSACLAKAQSVTADLDAKTKRLAQEWNPNGFYDPDQVKQLMNATFAVLMQAGANLDKQTAEGGTDAERGQLRDFRSNLYRHMDAMRPYIQAAQKARESNGVVDAPGLKKWVIDSMTAASSANDAAYVVGCQRPWWVGALVAFQAAFDALIRVAKAIVGVVVDIGKTVIKVFDYWTYIKWGLLIGGGLFAAYKVRNALAKP